MWSVVFRCAAGSLCHVHMAVETPWNMFTATASVPCVLGWMPSLKKWCLFLEKTKLAIKIMVWNIMFECWKMTRTILYILLCTVCILYQYLCTNILNALNNVNEWRRSSMNMTLELMVNKALKYWVVHEHFCQLIRLHTTSVHLWTTSFFSSRNYTRLIWI